MESRQFPDTVFGDSYPTDLKTVPRSGMKPTDRNPVTETRHRDQNFYPGSQD